MSGTSGGNPQSNFIYTIKLRMTAVILFSFFFSTFLPVPYLNWYKSEKHPRNGKNKEENESFLEPR